MRAICVLGVMLFHANLAFPGGFVGVDVFFVISGFLISKIILEEIRAGEFSLVGFWERRIRRIFPAVFVVQIAVLVAGFLLYFPEDYYRLLTASRYLTIGLPNIYYWLVIDYFHSGTTYPLLHTWSLGVEEQFYVAFPILMALMVRKCPRRIFGMLSLIGAISLGVAVHQMRAGQSSAAFYLLPGRAWELLAGCFLTIANPIATLDRTRRNAISTLGIVGILVTMMTFDEKMPFPGFAALAPVLSAYLFIAANEPDLTTCGRILSHRHLVTLGKMSFSLYLWHWPLICFADTYFPDNRWVITLAVGITVPIAYLAWSRVENPFRKKSVCSSRMSLFGFFLVANLCIVAFVQAGRMTGGYRSRTLLLPASVQDVYRQGEIDFEFVAIENCSQQDFLNGKTDFIGTKDPVHPSFFLWGDSHAMSVSRTIDQVGAESGLRGLYATSQGLDIIPPQNRDSYPFETRTPNTRAMNARMIESLKARDIRHLILISRWSFHLDYPDGATDFAAFLRSLREMAPEITVYVFSEVPKHRYEGISFRYQSILSESIGWPFLFRPTNQEDYLAQSSQFRQAMSLVKDPRIVLIDIADKFFDSNGLLVHRRGNRSLYFDDDHLSQYGADILMRPVIQDLLNRIRTDSGTPR